MAPSDVLLPAALRGRAGFVLTRLANTARQRSSDQLAVTGLSQHQHAILCCLEEFGPACQRDVAARLGLDTGDIVAFFDGLQQRELVDRRRDERDRRRQVVSLTPAGRGLLREAEELLDAVEPDLLAPLSPAESALLRRLATRVLAGQAPGAWGEAGPDGAGADPASVPTRLSGDHDHRLRLRGDHDQVRFRGFVAPRSKRRHGWALGKLSRRLPRPTTPHRGRGLRRARSRRLRLHRRGNRFDARGAV